MQWKNLPETPGSPCHWCDLINENKMIFDRDSLCHDCENCIDRLRYCTYTQKRGRYNDAQPEADSFDLAADFPYCKPSNIDISCQALNEVEFC